MQGQATTFEIYVLGLLAVLERLPVPIAISLDRSCERIQGNGAFRRLIGQGEYAFAAGDAETPRADLPLHRAAREGIEVVDFGMQLVRGDGTRFELVASAWPLRLGDSEAQGSIGVFVDITESKEADVRAQRAMEALAESERRYRLIAEALPEFVWLDAQDGSAIYSNKRWLEYTGLTEEQNEGFGWERVVHPDDLKRLESQRARTLRTGEPYENECRYRGKDGKYRWFLFRSIPVRDEGGTITSWLGTATDIDKQKRAEAQQAFFALASDMLGSTLDIATTLRRIARLAVASLGTWCQIDLPDSHGRLRVAVVAHEDPEKENVLARLVDEHPYHEEAPHGPPAVVRSVKPQLLQRVDEHVVAQVIPDPRHREIYGTVGYASGIMVPLRIGDRVLGSLGIASDDPTRLYTESDVTAALELGRRGAIALENAQSFQREHRVASTLQRALLPASLPENDDVAFSSAYAAAASAQGEAVGGDWYDAFPLEGGRIAVSVGDVAGHGVDAAVTMGVVRQAIRAAALEHHAPKEVLARANRVVTLDQRHSMITAFFGIYNPQTREFTYSVAGHPRPLLVNENGEISAFDCAGPPLGEAFDEVLLEQCCARVPPASAIVFFTDGLIEYARDVLNAEERLRAVMRELAFLNQENPAQAIIDAVLDGPQSDDIAVLVMRAY
jgi:PAS domain S-box-containing protein